MPTVDQLAAAPAATDADELIASQSGILRRITRAQLLAGHATPNRPAHRQPARPPVQRRRAPGTDHARRRARPVRRHTVRHHARRLSLAGLDASGEPRHPGRRRHRAHARRPAGRLRRAGIVRCGRRRRHRRHRRTRRGHRDPAPRPSRAPHLRHHRPMDDPGRRHPARRPRPDHPAPHRPDVAAAPGSASKAPPSRRGRHLRRQQPSVPGESWAVLVTAACLQTSFRACASATPAAHARQRPDRPRLRPGHRQPRHRRLRSQRQCRPRHLGAGRRWRAPYRQPRP